MLARRNTLVVYGFDELAYQLAAIGKIGVPAAEKAVYKGAQVIANQVRKNMQNLPTDQFRVTNWGFAMSAPSKAQKKALIDGFGITPMGNVRRIINVRIGYHGYMKDYPTKKYPKGLPIPMIANITETGSEYRSKTPFFRTAVTKTRKKAQQVMADTFHEEIEKITGGK